jgi:hypothetical protein
MNGRTAVAVGMVIVGLSIGAAYLEGCARIIAPAAATSLHHRLRQAAD